MGALNVPRAEIDALKAVDTGLLHKLIEQCLYEERLSPVQGLRLERCGLYVATRLQEFERALANHGKAKAAKKRAETESRVRRAGGDLEHAVQQMKERVAREEQESQLFYIDDQISPPYGFSERLTVRVDYRWREALEGEWKHGSITFSHDAEPRSHYRAPTPARKPSAAQQERERQDELYRRWEHLMSLALHSVREHFRRVGSGTAIPQNFQAKTDAFTGDLNNFSAQFWQ